MLAYADDEGRSNDAVTLGWIAIGLGIIANLLLVGFKLVRKLPIMKMIGCLLYTSPSPRDRQKSRMPSSA